MCSRCIKPKRFCHSHASYLGAGKSTFIETFGLHLTGLGHKVAVLV